MNKPIQPGEQGSAEALVKTGHVTAQALVAAAS